MRDASELFRLIQQGNAVRKVASTNMNDQSSRSHSCFTIKVQIKTTSDLGGGVTREQLLNSKMNLVDLAGSERAAKTGATGATLKEGAKINLSLMTLGTVINALSGGSQHVPYRDSKLTYLLSVSSERVQFCIIVICRPRMNSMHVVCIILRDLLIDL